jgi:hypothetical protein
MDIGDRKRLRFEILDAIYDAAKANVQALVEETSVLDHLGRDRDEFYAAVDYLIRERLLGRHGPQDVTITHEGIIEIERAHDYPDEPTEHFAPSNFTLINSMIGSSIQQGSAGAVQGEPSPLTCARTLLAFLNDPSLTSDADGRQLKALATELSDRLRAFAES